MIVKTGTLVVAEDRATIPNGPVSQALYEILLKSNTKAEFLEQADRIAKAPRHWLLARMREGWVWIA